MSREIVIVTKNGKVYAGDEYRFNHYTRQFELHNYVVLVASITPDEIKEIKVGKVSENNIDDRGIEEEEGF